MHHVYDPGGLVLYFGNGGRRSALGVRGLEITTVAGNGIGGYSGDGGPGPMAQLNAPNGVAVGPDGSLYIADTQSPNAQGNGRIRKVARNGTTTTVAGGGTCTGSCNGLPATAVALSLPTRVVVGPDNSLYIAQSTAIHRVSPSGSINLFAGGGTPSDGVGDGLPATQAQLQPRGLALAPDGSLYVADRFRVRRIAPTGIITTVAGTGAFGDSGDGGPATQAQFTSSDVALGTDGSLYIADGFVNRVHRVGIDGIIARVAGLRSGEGGLDRDGIRATQALLGRIDGIAVGPDGSLYISEGPLFRVRRVGPDGIINTIAGTGRCCTFPLGDGGPPTQAQLNDPRGVAVGPDGSLFIAQQGDHRVRALGPTLTGFSGDEILVPSSDGTELYRFDGNGRQLQTFNAFTGAPLYNFTYDAAGRLTQITDGDGLVTTIERDMAGNPTAIVAPGGQRTTLSLNAGGYLSRIADPLNNAVQLGYTSDGLLTSFTDPRGNVQTMTYDALGRLTKDQDPAGGFTALTRVESAIGLTSTLTTALNRTRNYRVENQSSGGELRVNTAPSGLQTIASTGIDASRTVTSPNGMVATTTAGPDPRFGMQAPLVKSQVVKTPGGLQSSLFMTRTLSLNDPANLLGVNTMTGTLTLNGRTATSVFQAATRTQTDNTPEGRQRVTQIDGRGRIVQRQVSGLDPVMLTYDSRGRLTRATQADRQITLAYDAQDRLTSVTDPLGRTLGYAYDAAGRMTSKTLMDGRVIPFAYDANGSATAITPPGRPAHNFTYNSLDLLQRYTPPTVGAGASIGAGANDTQYSYNPDRQLTGIDRPDGTAVALAYDSAGRLATLTQPRGTVTYTYHATTENLTGIAAPGGINLNYSYDGSLRTGVTLAGPVAGSVGVSYNNDFRFAATNVNGGQTVNFQYDRDGLLTGVGALALTRSAQNGLLTGTTLGSLTTSRNYDGFGELTSENASFNASVLLQAQYSRDQLGRIIRISETISSATDVYSYTRDLAGRLTEVKKNNTTVSTYSYDSNGNRLSHNATLATYDNQDRLLTYGAATYTYTPNGDLQSKISAGQTTTYTYDALGNLTAVSLPDGTQLAYLIDGLNWRVGKRVNGTLVQGWLYQNRLNPIAELDGGNNIVSRFVYGSRTNVPDYMVKGGVAYRILSDHLGSPRLVVNTATGAIAQQMNYDEFGNVTLDTNPGFQPFGFAGGLYDQHTQLTRFGARDYDALSGRWTAKDPKGFAGGDSNLYSYALGDPISFLDPAGGDVAPESTAEAAVYVVGAGLGFLLLAVTAPVSVPVGIVVAALGVGLVAGGTVVADESAAEIDRRNRKEAEEFQRKWAVAQKETQTVPPKADCPPPAQPVQAGVAPVATMLTTAAAPSIAPIVSIAPVVPSPRAAPEVSGPPSEPEIPGLEPAAPGLQRAPPLGGNPVAQVM